MRTFNLSLISDSFFRTVHVLNWAAHARTKNILFKNAEDPGSTLRICDFGSSRITDSETGSCPLHTDFDGISPVYAPPEVIRGALQGNLHTSRGSRVDARGSSERAGQKDSYDGRAFDLYSLGVVIWECWHQQLPELVEQKSSAPYPACIEDSDLSLEVLKKTVLGWRPDSSLAAGPLGAMPSVLVELVMSLWSDNPTARPSAAHVMGILDSPDVKNSIYERESRWGAARAEKKRKVSTEKRVLISPLLLP